jgi:hypothetical protein
MSANRLALALCMPSGERDHGAPIATEIERGVSRRLVLASSAGVQA